MDLSSPSDSTVIFGGGIIGLATAYYFSLHQPDLTRENRVHIIDSAPSLLLSASGFAGGFIAKDWFSSPSTSLGALSFRLHKELADAHDGRKKWGYAESTSYSLSVDEYGIGGKPTGKKIRGQDWLLEGTSRAIAAQQPDHRNGNKAVADGGGTESDEMLNEDGTPAWITKQEGGTLEVISSENGCAQVEPKELCEWLLSEIEARGVKIHLSSKVTGTMKDNDGKVQGVKLKDNVGEKILGCKSIVITAGAWSSEVFKTLFPESTTKIGIGPLAGYSITVRTPRYTKPILDPSKHATEGANGTCHSVFCGPGLNWSYAPEAISRIPKSGKPEIYVGGLNDNNMPLPPDVTGVQEMFDKEKARDLRRTCVLLTGLSREGDEIVDDDLEVVRESLCLRPISRRGNPIIAKLDQKQLGPGSLMSDAGGVYLAAGHGPWGISLSLGTGLVMSELLQGKKTSANVSNLGLR